MVTDCPAIGLFELSFNVTTTVATFTPSANTVDGVALIVEFTLLGAACTVTANDAAPSPVAEACQVVVCAEADLKYTICLYWPAAMVVVVIRVVHAESE